MNGARLAIVKDGARGAYASDGIHHAYVPCFVVSQVIDTVGCGDGFAAGVLSALLEGTSINSALTRGCAIGAMQTQSASDNDALPTREQLQEFINTHERVNANNSQQQQFKY